MSHTESSHQGVVCEACGHSPLERFHIPDRISLLHCPSCFLYQKGTVPDAAAYEIDYHSHYLGARSRKLRKARVRIQAISAVHNEECGRLLDIGCSVGWTVQAAQEMGWDAHGVDVSEGAVAVARERGLNCQTIEGTPLPFPDSTFDVVTAWHVIEHVPCVITALTEWHRALKPGGLLALETPDASSPKIRRLGVRYPKFWKPEHIYAFAPGNLTSFLDRTGFRSVPPANFMQAARISLPVLFDVAHLRARQALGIQTSFVIFARKIV